MPSSSSRPPSNLSFSTAPMKAAMLQVRKAAKLQTRQAAKPPSCKFAKLQNRNTIILPIC